MYPWEANQHWLDFKKRNKMADLNWQMKEASGDPPHMRPAAKATAPYGE